MFGVEVVDWMGERACSVVEVTRSFGADGWSCTESWAILLINLWDGAEFPDVVDERSFASSLGSAFHEAH